MGDEKKTTFLKMSGKAELWEDCSPEFAVPYEQDNLPSNGNLNRKKNRREVDCFSPRSDGQHPLLREEEEQLQ